MTSQYCSCSPMHSIRPRSSAVLSLSMFFTCVVSCFFNLHIKIVRFCHPLSVPAPLLVPDIFLSLTLSYFCTILCVCRADAETVFGNAWDVLKRCPNITLVRSRTVVPMFLR